jgi:hypothetical protein
VPRLALPVYLKIQGREKIEVVIQDLEASVQLSDSQQTPAILEVRTTLENLGSVHIRPSGSLALFQSDGSILRARPLGRSVPLLPRATLKIPAYFPLPAPGKYKAVVTVESEKEALLQREVSFVVTDENTVLSE